MLIVAKVAVALWAVATAVQPMLEELRVRRINEVQDQYWVGITRAIEVNGEIRIISQMVLMIKEEKTAYEKAIQEGDMGKIRALEEWTTKKTAIMQKIKIKPRVAA